MSTTERVQVSLFGQPRIGRVVQEAWAPSYNAQDRDIVTVDVDGSRFRVHADDVTPL